VLARSVAKGQKAKNGGKQYIVEDDDEPLDLLDRKVLAHVSSSKPVKGRTAADVKKKNAKTDLDGKLVFNDDSDDVLDFDDQGMMNGAEPGDGTLEGGINAYVAALKGRDAPQRGQRGKLKFKNSRSGDEMEVDEDDFVAAKKKHDGARSPAGKQTPQRRGLGMDKQRGSPGGGIHKGRGRGGFKHGVQSRRGGRR
jgi:ribosomal RNA-processing protein 12